MSSNYLRFIAIILTVMGVYLLFSPAHYLTTPDETLNLRTTLSLLEGQRAAVPPLPGEFASKRGIDGKQYAQYGLGLPVASASWAAIGRLWAPDNIDFGEWLSAGPWYDEEFLELTERNEDRLEFLRFWLTIFGMMISALSAALLDAILRRCGLSSSMALLGALLLAFCTYQWQHGRTFFTEPLVACCLLASFYSLLRWREERAGKWIAVAGFFWGYALLTRNDTLFAFPAALWLLSVTPRGERIQLDIDYKRWLLFGAPVAAVFLTILLYNQYRFDSFFTTGYEAQVEGVRFATPLLVGLHGFLFTPGRSLFLYSPPLIFAFLGMRPLRQRDPWLMGGLLILIACYLISMSKWQNWAGGYDWGPRHIFQVTPFVMIFAAMGVARWLDGARWKRYVFGFVIVLGVGMQLLGLAADPVETTRAFLERWPDAPIAGGLTVHGALMQFTVYLPQFSGPVMHTSAVMADGPNFLLWRTAEEAPHRLVWFAIPLLMALIGGWGLRRFTRDETD